MLWFILWAVLVVGALVGAFFLLRDVYRSGRALVEAGGRAADVVGEAADHAADLAAAAQAGWTPLAVVLDDPAPARERRTVTAAASARRRAARRARHEATYERWRAFSR